MLFEVIVKKKALSFVRKLDLERKQKIETLLNTLERDPIPYQDYDIKKLKGFANVFRIRIGSIRVIYEIRESELKIIVRRIHKRGKVYK